MLHSNVRYNRIQEYIYDLNFFLIALKNKFYFNKIESLYNLKQNNFQEGLNSSLRMDLQICTSF